MTIDPTNPSDRGFTLLEMLVALSIIALLGSLSIGAYQVAYRTYMLAASAGEVQAILRAARNTSITTGTPSTVVIDPTRRTVRAQSYETLDEWTFDGPAGGGTWGQGGSRALQGTVPGRVGQGLAASDTYVSCGNQARYNVRDGLYIAVWLRHGRESAVKPPYRDKRRQRVRIGKTTRSRREEAASVILAKKGAYFLGMTDSGALEAAIGEHRVRTDPGVVTPLRWVYVTFRFDGERLALSADGVERDTTLLVAFQTRDAKSGKAPRAPSEIPVTSEPLTISSPDQPFPGHLDELRLGGRIQPLFYEINEGEHFIGWKKVIHFDRRGHLDPAYHEEGLRIVLVELPDEVSSSRTVVAIDYSRTYDEWLESRGETDVKGRWQRGKKPENDHVSQRVEELRIENRYRAARKAAIEIDLLGVVK